MIYRTLAGRIPGPLRAYILHFESAIERAVSGFASSLPPGARVLDAGAGEGQYKHHFHRQRYLAVDLGIGDAAWNYRGLDCIADLTRLPLRPSSCDAAINIVTLEHVRDPLAVLREIAAVLKPGAPLLLVVPHEWEVHQIPHDYFRFTRYGVQHLLEAAGFADLRIAAAGGYFRLLSRRLLNGLQFFPGLLMPLAALTLGPLALLAPLFDNLDREQNFTLGYIATARKR